MQKATAAIKTRRRGSHSSQANKEQKRKSALISMGVPAPVTPASPSHRKPVSTAPPPATVRRMSSSSSSQNQKPNLVRVVSVDSSTDAVVAAQAIHRHSAPPQQQQQQLEDASFHEDLDRLGLAIRSLSFIEPDTTSAAAVAVGLAQEPSATGEETMNVNTNNPVAQNPFDAPAPATTTPSPPPPAAPENPTIQNPFDEPIVPAQVESRPVSERRASQNPFDHHALPTADEPAAAAGNPFDDVLPNNSTNNHMEDEKVLLARAELGIDLDIDIDTHFDVPLDGEKRVLKLSPQASREELGEVPLDGTKVLMSPSSNPYHDNSHSHEEDGEKVILADRPLHESLLHVPLDGEKVIMSRSFDENTQGNETSDDEDDEEDEIGVSMHSQHQVQAAGDLFSFC